MGCIGVLLHNELMFNVNLLVKAIQSCPAELVTLPWKFNGSSGRISSGILANPHWSSRLGRKSPHLDGPRPLRAMASRPDSQLRDKLPPTERPWPCPS